MACIRANGHLVPLFFPLEHGRSARVSSHLLHVRFKFVESSIYVEEERESASGVLHQSIPVVKSVEEDGHCWYLTSGNYRAYGLPLSMVGVSTEILSRQSDGLTVDMPYVTPSPPREVILLPLDAMVL